MQIKELIITLELGLQIGKKGFFGVRLQSIAGLHLNLLIITVRIFCFSKQISEMQVPLDANIMCLKKLHFYAFLCIY